MGQLWDDAPHDAWMDLSQLIKSTSRDSGARVDQRPDPSINRHLLAQRGVAIQRGIAWMKSRLDLDLYDEPDAFI